MPIITVPKVLREKLGEDGADALVELVNVANGQTKADVLTFVEEKFERRLSDEIGKVRQEMSGEFAKVRQEMSGLRQEASESKVELIRWMFLFWVGQVAVVFGILFAFFRK